MLCRTFLNQIQLQLQLQTRLQLQLELYNHNSNFTAVSKPLTLLSLNGLTKYLVISTSIDVIFVIAIIKPIKMNIYIVISFSFN